MCGQVSHRSPLSVGTDSPSRWPSALSRLDLPRLARVNLRGWALALPVYAPERLSWDPERPLNKPAHTSTKRFFVHDNVHFGMLRFGWQLALPV